MSTSPASVAIASFLRSRHRLLAWFPRGLAILYVLFMSSFALDVFGAGYGFGETLVALFMHLLPELALLVALGVAWNRASIGGLLFWLLGIAFTIQFDTYEHPLNFALISLPIFVIGACFLLQHRFTPTS